MLSIDNYFLVHLPSNRFPLKVFTALYCNIESSNLFSDQSSKIRPYSWPRVLASFALISWYRKSPNSIKLIVSQECAPSCIPKAISMSLDCRSLGLWASELRLAAIRHIIRNKRMVPPSIADHLPTEDGSVKGADKVNQHG